MTADVPEAIRDDLVRHVADVVDFSFAGGGCINHGGRVQTARGDFFLKWNDAHRFPHMFEAEARGLRLLSDAGALRIPNVRFAGHAGGYQYLMIEYIRQSPRRPDYWTRLGEQLAVLHGNTSALFGLDHDNFIGSLPQENTVCDDWVDFFIRRRLQVQVGVALHAGKIGTAVARNFETLYRKLPSILTGEPPALLHGDLWSGNVITDDQGMPCLIDPAAYYGHREVELAFTTLFGGFSPAFYDSYKHNFPIPPGFEERWEVYNLYPLLVHVNLFGESYASQVVSILRRFV